MRPIQPPVEYRYRSILDGFGEQLCVKLENSAIGGKFIDIRCGLVKKNSGVVDAPRPRQLDDGFAIRCRESFIGKLQNKKTNVVMDEVDAATRDHSVCGGKDVKLRGTRVSQLH